jgi:hypothetical protein
LEVTPVKIIVDLLGKSVADQAEGSAALWFWSISAKPSRHSSWICRSPSWEYDAQIFRQNIQKDHVFKQSSIVLEPLWHEEPLRIWDIILILQCIIKMDGKESRNIWGRGDIKTPIAIRDEEYHITVWSVPFCVIGKKERGGLISSDNCSNNPRFIVELTPKDGRSKLRLNPR